MAGNPFETAPAATTVVEPVVAPAPVAEVVPAVEAPAPKEPAAKEAPVVEAPAGEGTLLGDEPKTAEEIAAAEKAAADAKAEVLKNETPEAKAIREKAEADAAAAGKTVPDKYVIKAPEGMKVDEVFLNDKLAPVLKEHKITQEAFQKIIDVYAPHLQEQLKAGITLNQDEAIKVWKDNIKAWGDETKQVYGPKLNAEMAYAAKAINKFSSDPKALRELLNDKPGTTGTGIGNHKLIVEMFIKAGKLLGEDTFPSGKGPAAGELDNSDDAKAERMFGKK